MITFILLAMVVGITSCKKDKENDDITNPNPTPTATIAISEPEDMQMFDGGETVHIHAHISAPFDLHGYELFIINESSGDTVWTIDEHTHSMEIHIEETWVNDVTMHSDMVLQVKAIIDHDGNFTIAERHFHCHPM